MPEISDDEASLLLLSLRKERKPKMFFDWSLGIDLKPKRKRASKFQDSVLRKIFEHTHFPSTELREELGKSLRMNPRTVQIWFQNRRQAMSRKEIKNRVPINCELDINDVHRICIECSNKSSN